MQAPLPADAPDDKDPAGFHLRRAVAGDHESQAWLIEHFTPPLWVAAQRRHNKQFLSLSDPEDVIQEVWASAWPRLGSLRSPDGRFTPVLLQYLGTILLNRYRDLARRHVRGSGATARGQASDTDELASRLPDMTSGIVTKATRKEVVKRFEVALAGLDECDRDVLVMRGLEQRPVREVAQLLEIGEATVSNRYRRALPKLRNALPGTVLDFLEQP
jgi:RNA polymerase sigma-70 factor (ECF subfamily)